MAYFVLDTAKNVLGDEGCLEWANCGRGEVDLPEIEKSLVPVEVEKDGAIKEVSRPGKGWRLEVMPIANLYNGHRLELLEDEVYAWNRRGETVYAMSEHTFDSIFC